MNALLFVHLVVRAALAVEAMAGRSVTRGGRALAAVAVLAACWVAWLLFDGVGDPSAWTLSSALQPAAVGQVLTTALLFVGMRLVRDVHAAAQLTERATREAAERVRDDAHAASCRRMAEAFAHRVRDLLTGLRGATDLLAETLQHDPDVRPLLRQLRSSLAAGDRLSTDLSGLVGQGDFAPSRVDVTEVARGVAQRLRATTHVQVELEVDVAAADVLVDPAQLGRCVWRLVGNAVDALPAGGTLALSTSSMRVHTGDSRRLTPGRWVCLEVRDTGPGMDSDRRRRALEPFFSTSGGAGLGLPAVSAFAEQSGGHFELKSRPGLGTVARLLLPAATSARDTGRDAGPAPRGPASPALGGRRRPAPGEGPRVLVAEDAESVRLVARALLERIGCQVDTARDGREALAMLRAADFDYALVLTDVVMPRLGGPELYDALRRCAPSLPVVFMTGHRATRYARDYLPEGVSVIAKPFGLEALRLAVHMALTEGARTAGAPTAATLTAGAPTAGATADRSRDLGRPEELRPDVPAPLPAGLVQSPVPSDFAETRVTGWAPVSALAALAAPRQRGAELSHAATQRVTAKRGAQARRGAAVGGPSWPRLATSAG